ncbi:MAG: LD-carboxypeptidase [Bacteroidales bacterium]|nr:LD-carboxypeptidase [Bacteroidales bacterium]
MIKIPALLKKGDKVAIVAPGSKFDVANLTFGIKVLESWGLHVELGKHLYNSSGYFSATDTERLEDLQKALDDEKIKAIFCARGGYGTVRIINNIDFSKFQKIPKWIIGFSDITYLLNKIQLHNIACIHGPMPASFHRYQKNHSLKNLYNLLFEGYISYKLSSQYIKIFNDSKIFAYPVTGGNLTILSHTIGTPYSINPSNKIILIEDINEEPYKIERYIYHLYHSGCLENVKGLILANFQFKKQKDFIFSIENIINTLNFSQLSFILKNFPVGHGLINYPVVLNIPLHIEVKPNYIRISQHIV